MAVTKTHPIKSTLKEDTETYRHHPRREQALGQTSGAAKRGWLCPRSSTGIAATTLSKGRRDPGDHILWIYDR